MSEVVYSQKHANFEIQVITTPAGKVQLIDYPNNPETTVSRLCKGYEGTYEGEQFFSVSEIQKAFYDVKNTKLQTPMEMINTVWLITGVTRAFTHQLVRTRLASYVQESMRFLGHKGIYQILATGDATRSKMTLGIYSEAVANSIVAYEKLLELGIESEDSRGVLPTNILTAVYVGLPLNSLAHMYQQRMCCQAQQGEWQPLLRQMKQILKEQVSEKVAELLSAPYERGEPCGYRASFDRPCKWQKDSNEQ
jgi:thymidylate synthase (FAD)